MNFQIDERPRLVNVVGATRLRVRSIYQARNRDLTIELSGGRRPLRRLRRHPRYAGEDENTGTGAPYTVGPPRWGTLLCPRKASTQSTVAYAARSALFRRGTLGRAGWKAGQNPQEISLPFDADLLEDRPQLGAQG